MNFRLPTQTPNRNPFYRHKVNNVQNVLRIHALNSVEKKEFIALDRQCISAEMRKYVKTQKQVRQMPCLSRAYKPQVRHSKRRTSLLRCAIGGCASERVGCDQRPGLSAAAATRGWGSMRLPGFSLIGVSFPEGFSFCKRKGSSNPSLELSPFLVFFFVNVFLFSKEKGWLGSSHSTTEQQARLKLAQLRVKWESRS